LVNTAWGSLIRMRPEFIQQAVCFGSYCARARKGEGKGAGNKQLAWPCVRRLCGSWLVLGPRLGPSLRAMLRARALNLARLRRVGPARISWRIFWDITAFAAPYGHSDIKYLEDSDIGYFSILQQMSGYADRIHVFGYFAILLQVQVPGTGTVSAPQILILGYP
jgi:hypothetical protein